MSFSKFLLEYRNTHKLSQTELAKAFKVSKKTIQDIENGNTIYPNLVLKDHIDDYFIKKGLKRSDVTYQILFNDKADTGYNLEEKYKKYLAIRKSNLYQVDIDFPCKMTNGSNINLIGAIWVPRLTYYKILIANYNRKPFIKALTDKNKNIDAFIHTIISETKFFDNIKDKTQYKDIRFILDKNNKEDRTIYKEICKIKMPNHGKLADISFQLFDSINGQTDTDIYYVTERNSKINIDSLIAKMAH